MHNFPCCVPFLCGSLLLISAVDAARNRHNIGGAVAGKSDDVALGVTNADAHSATSNSEGTDRFFNEASVLAATLWAHTQVVPCLEATSSSDGANPGQKNGMNWMAQALQRVSAVVPAVAPQKMQLMRTVWELELNHTTGSILKNSVFATIQKTIRSITRSNRPLEEHVYMETLKRTLKDVYHFDYDAIKEKCLRDLEPRFNRTVEMAANELSNGCMGTCSKKSIFYDHVHSLTECHESDGASFCPEGTKCGCHFQKDHMLAAVVGTIAVAAYTGISAIFMGPMVGLLIPGKAEIGVLAAALASSKATGCRCLPAPCKWDKTRQTCAPTPVKGARNPFQAVLPYVGMKCAAKPTEIFAHLGVEHALVPPCAKVQPCMPEDFDKIGQVGTGTYNCRHQSGEDDLTFFPPLEERLVMYKELFPDVAPGAHSGH